jgi:hypothetical protein
MGPRRLQQWRASPPTATLTSRPAHPAVGRVPKKAHAFLGALMGVTSPSSLFRSPAGTVPPWVSKGNERSEPIQTTGWDGPRVPWVYREKATRPGGVGVWFAHLIEYRPLGGRRVVLCSADQPGGAQGLSVFGRGRTHCNVQAWKYPPVPELRLPRRRPLLYFVTKSAFGSALTPNRSLALA